MDSEDDESSEGSLGSEGMSTDSSESDAENNSDSSDESFSAGDVSSESSDEEDVFEDPNEVINAIIQVQDLSDDEFEASGFSPTTIKMTVDWSKRWLACMSNNPVSPNFYHDFAIFFLTFQSGSRNSPVCKMELSDIVEIRMRPDTCEIFVLLRFHELKAHAPGAEYMRYFSGYLHDHPHWPTDFIWHLHRYLIFRTKGVTGLLRPRIPHPSIYKDARIDLSILTPTIAELRNGDFTTIKNYDLEGEKLWKRKSVRHANQANNAAIQSRFAFYPEHLLRKMTMHSFRAGFFVSHVTHGVHEPSNGYSIERAL
ncbi:hypothetical protein TrCOL_g5557, partial [Triparma columacea]